MELVSYRMGNCCQDIITSNNIAPIYHVTNRRVNVEYNDANDGIGDIVHVNLA
jgi:hypothetical protein